MKRFNVNKGHAARKFSRSAGKMKAANLPRGPMRGGIRF